MATHLGGSGQPLDRDITTHKKADTETEHAQEFHQINPNDFKESYRTQTTKTVKSTLPISTTRTS